MPLKRTCLLLFPSGVVFFILLLIYGNSNNKITTPEGSLMLQTLDKKLISRYGVLTKQYFNIKQGDLLIFHHIQKTGGSAFTSHIAKHLNVPEYPCKCNNKKQMHYHCVCNSPIKQSWFSGRFIHFMCGIHASWTQYKECLPKIRKKFNQIANKQGIPYTANPVMFTLLRKPVIRFISEWQEIIRKISAKGYGWEMEKRWCADSWKKCTGFNKKTSLSEFTSCPGNLGRDRMTRMMADMTEFNCKETMTNTSIAEKKKMLVSAKKNLAKLPLFGLNEHLQATQYLFTWKFGVDFGNIMKSQNSSHISMDKISKEDFSKVERVNSYDERLYKFAENLFFTRLSNAVTVDEKQNITVPSDVLDSLKIHFQKLSTQHLDCDMKLYNISNRLDLDKSVLLIDI